LHDFTQLYLVRGSGQPDAALGPSRAPEDAGGDERRDEMLKVHGGNLLSPGDVSEQDWLALAIERNI
jgi:hypothetical protein